MIPLIPRGISFDKDGTKKYKTFESGETSIAKIISNREVSFESGRGRKSGSGTLPLSHIVGLVDDHIEKDNVSKEVAFDLVAVDLENAGLKVLDQDYIKKVYYNAKKKIRPYFIIPSDIDELFNRVVAICPSIVEQFTEYEVKECIVQYHKDFKEYFSITETQKAP